MDGKIKFENNPSKCLLSNHPLLTKNFWRQTCLPYIQRAHDVRPFVCLSVRLSDPPSVAGFLCLSPPNAPPTPSASAHAGGTLQKYPLPARTLTPLHLVRACPWSRSLQPSALGGCSNTFFLTTIVLLNIAHVTTSSYQGAAAQIFTPRAMTI